MLFLILFLIGTPHEHALYAVKSTDGISSDDIMSDDPVKLNRLKDYIESKITAKIVPRNPDDNDHLPAESQQIYRVNETRYNWQPEKNYFADLLDPRRNGFDPTWDYTRFDVNTFADKRVQKQYRENILANQMHKCCFTCWKNNSTGDISCRFNFPWDESVASAIRATIIHDMDKRSRRRVRIIPSRNNAYMNPTCYDPLLNIAHGSNLDAQWIDSPLGAAEYATNYISKEEKPDRQRMINLYTIKLALIQENSNPTDREKLKTVCESLLRSLKVGTVQVCL